MQACEQERTTKGKASPVCWKAYTHWWSGDRTPLMTGGYREGELRGPKVPKAESALPKNMLLICLSVFQPPFLLAAKHECVALWGWNLKRSFWVHFPQGTLHPFPCLISSLWLVRSENCHSRHREAVYSKVFYVRAPELTGELGNTSSQSCPQRPCLSSSAWA